MSDVTIIGQGAFVRGRIAGSGDLEISGRVEGEVSVSGELVIEASGLVAAPLSARRLVVRGAVKGDLTASEAVVLEAGAKVVGDVHAPRIAIAPGALVRGYVQTGAQTASASAAQREKPRAVPKPAPKAEVRPAPRAETPPALRAETPPARTNGAPRGSVLAGMRQGPPAPIVPVIKKGTKAVHKKRAT